MASKLVLFTDEKGEEHLALLTHQWTEECINLVYVTKDASKKDDYGMQIERRSSVPKKNGMSAPGYFYEELEHMLKK